MAARFGVGGGNKRTSNACFLITRKPKEQINQQKRNSKAGLIKVRSSDSHANNSENNNLLSLNKRVS
jgi:hypothetical protein